MKVSTGKKRQKKLRTQKTKGKLQPNISQVITNVSVVLGLILPEIRYIVRTKILDKFLREIKDGREKTRPGRTFPRISRKPINRWQKSIAKEHEKKKRLAAKGLAP